MGRTRVLVEISPSRLELAVVRAGRTIERRSTHSEKPDWGGAWPDALKALSPLLARWVGELGLNGHDAEVCYGPGGSVSGVFSCPASAGAGGAENAATLALQEFAGFAVQTGVTDCRLLGVDGRGAERRMHTLAAADREEHLLAIAGVVQSAGLRPATMMPIDACALGVTVSQLTGAAGKGVLLLLWIGEHSSVLAASSHGRLRFVRTVGVGVESLVEALCRPLRARGQAEPVSLSRTEARALLEMHGVPRAEDVLDAARGLEGAGVLPVIQPALQRLGVELKQSLRFGLDEKERVEARLQVIGPGASIARLPEAIAHQCATGLESGREAAGTGASHSQGQSLLSAVAAGLAPSLCLLPEGLAGARSARRARRAVWAGLAAAVGMVGMLATWVHLSLASEVRALETAEQAAKLAQGSAQSAASAEAELAGMRATRGRVSKALGESPDWAATLRAISERTPETIRLTSIDFKNDEEGMRALLIGYALDPAHNRFADTLKGYADALGACPLVAGIKMGATTRIEVRQQPAHRFELSVTLVGLPPAQAALEPKEQTP